MKYHNQDNFMTAARLPPLKEPFIFHRALRSAHTIGLVPATSPCNKS